MIFRATTRSAVFPEEALQQTRLYKLCHDLDKNPEWCHTFGLLRKNSSIFILWATQ